MWVNSGLYARVASFMLPWVGLLLREVLNFDKILEHFYFGLGFPLFPILKKVAIRPNIVFVDYVCYHGNGQFLLS